MKPTDITRFRRGPDRRVNRRPFAEERRRGDRRAAELQWIPLFRNADPRDLAEALVECEVLELQEGTPLLRAGETNRSVFILLSGRLLAHLGAETDTDTAIEILS